MMNEMMGRGMMWRMDLFWFLVIVVLVLAGAVLAQIHLLTPVSRWLWSERI